VETDCWQRQLELEQTHLESQCLFFLLIEVQESVKKQEIARGLEQKTAKKMEERERDGLNNTLLFSKRNNISSRQFSSHRKSENF
jgi:hypothetical protein